MSETLHTTLCRYLSCMQNVYTILCILNYNSFQWTFTKLLIHFILHPTNSWLPAYVLSLDPWKWIENLFDKCYFLQMKTRHAINTFNLGADSNNHDLISFFIPVPEWFIFDSVRFLASFILYSVWSCNNIPPSWMSNLMKLELGTLLRAFHSE